MAPKIGLKEEIPNLKKEGKGKAHGAVRSQSKIQSKERESSSPEYNRGAKNIAQISSFFSSEAVPLSRAVVER